MKYLDIGSDRVPALGFGTWQLHGVSCRFAVRRALETGYRHIDTARMYDNEGDVGGAVAESGIDRSEIFLTTKIWHEHLSPQRLRAEFDDSLKWLRSDYVDLLLIHWPNPEIPLEPTLDEMQRLQEERRVRHIGVSNFTRPLLEEAAAHAPVVCNQVEYHPLLDQSEMLEFVRKRGMVLVSYCPLAQGRVLDDRRVREIAERHGRQPSQVVLRWHLQQDAVGAIPRSENPAHIQANFDCFDFELDEPEMRALFALARDERLIDPSWAPSWGVSVPRS